MRFFMNGEQNMDQATESNELEVHARRNETDLFICPMHPEVKQDGPGSCPKCGMALEAETLAT